MIIIIIIIVIIVVVVVVIIINIIIMMTIIIIIIIVIIFLKGCVYIMADCIYRYCKLVMNQNVINMGRCKNDEDKVYRWKYFVIKIKTDTVHKNW